MNSWDLLIEVINRINKSWTLEQYVFDIILTSSILSITIDRKERNDKKFTILSVSIFKDIQIIIDKDKNDENEGYTNITYNTSDEKFVRFIEFIESVHADLEYDDNDNIYIYVILPIIFPKAIEIGEDYLVEAIVDKYIVHYNNNYDKCFAPKILSIITTSFSELHNTYPNYAKKVISTLTIYNSNKNHDLKMRNTDKEHLESYSDYTKDSKIFKITNCKFRFNDFLYSPLELSLTFIITILYLSLFFVYNQKDVLVSFY
ncbi:unnamed protein product [Rhizophagus irregularis]|nr:unnamed protein product [Rhizophagus irregularis]